ncbi:NAD-dependent epimerase/dehydratase family protein [Patescibacteria group bacterium]|nr:NAD-dependent epimerase/dehydratase family protein [Patescibacteria group bacterium]
METAYTDKKIKSKGEVGKPTALVAGGAGFLGSYLCEALVAQNLNVICVDNLAHGSKANIENLLSLPNFTFWQEDINKPEFTVPPTIELTHVFHLASVEEHLSSNEITLQTLIVNSLGTKNLLDLAVAKKSKFILVSSTEVFQGVLSQTNLVKYFGEADPAKLTFAEAKRFAEALSAEYLKKYNLSTVVVRIKDLYGPRMSLAPADIIGNLINQAVSKNKIEIIGDGLKTINPTFVTDIVYGIVKAAFQGDKGDIFNLISPEKVTERAVAELLKTIVGVEVEYKEKNEVEPPTHPLIFSKTVEKLRWSTKVPLDQGLSQTVAFYKGKGKEIKKDTPKPAIPPLRKEERGINKNIVGRLITASLIALIIWLVGVPVAASYGNLYFGNNSLEAAVNNLSKNETRGAIEKSQSAQKSYESSLKGVGNISWLPNILGQKDKTQQAKNYLLIAEELSKATSFIGQTLELISEATRSDKSTVEVLEKTQLAKDTIAQAKKSMDVASSVNVDKEKLPYFFKDSFTKRQKDIETLGGLINSIEANLDLLP